MGLAYFLRRASIRTHIQGEQNPFAYLQMSGETKRRTLRIKVNIHQNTNEHTHRGFRIHETRQFSHSAKYTYIHKSETHTSTTFAHSEKKNAVNIAHI